jgi:ribA/ribD-fused uncharacterized protein
LITNFHTPGNEFLSNFYISPINILGNVYLTIEHGYQAMKAARPDEAESIRLAPSAAIAKKYGKKITKRGDWEDIKDSVMYFLLQLKFNDIELAKKLAETKPHELIEGNTWGDTYWGQCPIGNGKNMLGKLLMEIRGN